MTHSDFDILVAGGGLAGKLAAAVLGSIGFEVACCDPSSECFGEATPADNRVTALLHSARRVLQHAGIWEGVRVHGRTLSALRILDSGEHPPQTSSGFEFLSSEIGYDCFGWTVRNTELNDLLDDRIAGLPSVTMMRGCNVEQLTTRTVDVNCRLSDRNRIRCRLVIAADGRASTVRTQLGIGLRQAPCEGFALSFNVDHLNPTDGVTVELHGKGESITVIPMPDDDFRSSVVWMTDRATATELAGRDDGSFLSRLRDSLMGHAGELAGVSRRGLWPSRGQVANRLGEQRAVLIGEAAHMLSPVGAQGFNSTVADVDALADLLLGNRNDPGANSVVSGYQRRRQTDVHLRVAATGLLQIAAISRFRPMRHARRVGLEAIHGVSGVRRALMRAGMGRLGGGRSVH